MPVLRNPPDPQNKYGSLKACLLAEFTLSSSERAAALLDLPGLGDMKPTQLLNRMKELFPEDEKPCSCCLFRELFLRQLPPDVRSHLADKAKLPLDELAAEADNFFTSTGQRVNSVHAEAVVSAAREQAPRSERLCFFHERFGKKARKCRPPCKFSSEN